MSLWTIGSEGTLGTIWERQTVRFLEKENQESSFLDKGSKKWHFFKNVSFPVGLVYLM
jgi:hypothetical protein